MKALILALTLTSSISLALTGGISSNGDDGLPPDASAKLLKCQAKPGEPGVLVSTNILKNYEGRNSFTIAGYKKPNSEIYAGTFECRGELLSQSEGFVLKYTCARPEPKESITLEIRLNPILVDSKVRYLSRFQMTDADGTKNEQEILCFTAY